MSKQLEKLKETVLIWIVFFYISSVFFAILFGVFSYLDDLFLGCSEDFQKTGIDAMALNIYDFACFIALIILLFGLAYCIMPCFFTSHYDGFLHVEVHDSFYWTLFTIMSLSYLAHKAYYLYLYALIFNSYLDFDDDCKESHLGKLTLSFMILIIIYLYILMVLIGKNLLFNDCEQPRDYYPTNKKEVKT